jgi:methylase of polypeptide subunit release factors
MDILGEYQTVKEYYDEELNKNKDLVKTSNDEPTPISCVEEMVDKLPESIFIDSKNKFLDPCCGCGNFFIVIFKRLLKYHKPQHIIENMFYFNDTNEDRLSIVRKVFRGHEFSLNISNKDFLEFEPHIHFDLIVANPPYACLMNNGKRASKNHNMIGGFIKKSFSMLKDKGHLLYITPDNWMSCADRNVLIKEITSKQIIHLNIHTAKKYFKKVGSSFTWYIIENTPYYKDFTVEGQFKKIHYTDTLKSEERYYIPLYYNSIIQSIISKTLDSTVPKFKVETSSDLHKYTKKHLIQSKKEGDYTYKLHHTPSQTVWASRPHKYQDGYKVYLGTTSYYNVFVDGPNCGMTQSIAFIRCEDKEQADKYKDILCHPLYVFLNNICRYGNFNNVRIFQKFPVCDSYDDVYSNFDITDEEKKLIEST